ncbi:hypothetical protein ACFL0X_01435 [Nanoarchaeota archaeon]
MSECRYLEKENGQYICTDAPKREIREGLKICLGLEEQVDCCYSPKTSSNRSHILSLNDLALQDID